MKRKHLLLFILGLILGIIIFICWNYREHPLISLLPEEEMTKCVSSGYHDELGLPVECVIPKETVLELFDSAVVRKGTKALAMPSTCIEIKMTYDSEMYLVVVGADNTVSVTSVDDLDSRSFWNDVNGTLFEELYHSHLQNGGEKFTID